MEWKILLIFSLLIVGIYLFPSATARFAGSHTMEFNQSGGATEFRCTTCHEYIFDELNLTQESREVLLAHRNAAGNATYTSTLLNPNVSNSTDNKFCSMCHLAKTTIETHTQILVRPCTDLSCHGDNETYENDTLYPEARSMGPKLGNITNVHERWFDQSSGYDSQYLNETGANYAKGYFTCLGCHTSIGVELNRTGTEYFAHNDSNALQRRYI
ncbi:MAG: hypothetical protein V3T58_04745 [Candidatus Hydrothermarchaeales archaeon]